MKAVFKKTRPVDHIPTIASLGHGRESETTQNASILYSTRWETSHRKKKPGTICQYNNAIL